MILPYLNGCANEVLVPEPVIVEVVTVERLPVPADLLIQRTKSTVPEALTYGDGLQLWAEDRANLDSVNAQLGAIDGLGNSE